MCEVTISFLSSNQGGFSLRLANKNKLVKVIKTGQTASRERIEVRHELSYKMAILQHISPRKTNKLKRPNEGDF
jgi:hypothetical protein